MKPLLFLLLMLLLPTSASAQTAELPARHGPEVSLTTGLGGGAFVTGFEAQFGDRWRIAPDLLLGDGGAIGAVWLIHAAPGVLGDGAGVYAGVGIGAFAARGFAGRMTMIRVGLERDLGGSGLGLRTGVRGYFTSVGDGGYGAVVALRYRFR